MKRGLICILFLLMATSGLSEAVPIEISEEFFNEDIVIFYLSDFNLENPQNNPLIFEYYIGNKNYRCVFPEPVEVSLEFHFRARIRSLGWTDYRPVTSITLNPFTLHGPCRISNQIISSNFSNFLIPYDCPEAIGTGNPYVNLNSGHSDVDKSALSSLSNTILSTGQLPGGSYAFEVRIINEGTGQVSELTKSIRVVSPTSLDLIAPGGPVSSVRDFESLYNRFPTFQWESEACPSCEYSVRICEFIPGLHAGTFDAIRDESVLPFPDNGDFHPLPNQVTTLNYDPASAGKDLEFGKYYVWQVQKTFETSGGTQSMKSEIFGFYLEDPSAGQSTAGRVDPLEEMLREILGERRIETLMGSQLNGFRPSGRITINGRPVTINELRLIADGIRNGSYTIQNVFVE